jgi:CRISPR/Cas system-associated exonuclease Cas4 (RecB family)
VTDLRAAFVLVGLLAIALAAWAAREMWRARGMAGTSVVEVDTERGRQPLRSTNWGLVGRPDEILRLSDGRHVPVEVKSRASPRRGVPASHRLQLYAYLALLEDQRLGTVPFGVLRYGDGGEFRLPWDDAARAELATTLAAARRPYDGRARPGPDRCPRCPWFERCDARWSA